MKLIYIINFVLILNSNTLSQDYDLSPFEQKDPEHWQIEKKRISIAKVISLRVIRITYNGDGLLKDSLQKYYYEYDTRGNEVTFEMFNESNGYSCGLLKLYYDSLDNESAVVEYTKEHGTQVILDSTLYFYNNFDKLVKYIEFNRKGEVISQGHYEYDSKKQETYTETNSADSSYFADERFFYDKNGKLLYSIKKRKNAEDSTYRIDTNHVKEEKNDRLKITRNKKGNIEEWIDNRYSTKQIIYQFNFNKNDDVTEAILIKNGELIYKEKTAYNDFMLKSQEVYYNKLGKITEKLLYLYTFY